MTEPGEVTDESSTALSRLLTELAEDPAAPPTSLSPASIIAAARAAETIEAARTAGREAPADSPGPSGPEPVATAAPAGPAAADGTVPGATGGTVVDASSRFGRRRALLISLVAAACLVVVAGVAIPLALRPSEESSTAAAPAEATTSSSVAGAGPAAPADSAAAGDQAQPPTPAATPESAPTAGVAPGRSAEGGSAGEAEQPQPSTAAGEPGCAWPALSDPAIAALAAALPAGQFGPAQPLNSGCRAEQLQGNRLPNTAGAADLAVTIVTSPSGACAQGSGATEAGARCVPRGDGVYVATGPDGSTVAAYVYRDGVEVAASQSISGAAPRPTSLTADRLIAAAEAVVSAGA